MKKPSVVIRALHMKTNIFGVILGGSWLVISRVLSRAAVVITYTRGLITYNHTYNYP